MKKIFLGFCLIVLFCTSCTGISTYNQNKNVMEKKYYLSPLNNYNWRIKGDMPLIDIETSRRFVEQSYYLPKRYRVIKE